MLPILPKNLEFFRKPKVFSQQDFEYLYMQIAIIDAYAKVKKGVNLYRREVYLCGLRQVVIIHEGNWYKNKEDIAYCCPTGASQIKFIF